MHTVGFDEYILHSVLVGLEDFLSHGDKGAVRGDYFWGSGGDDVLEVAGKMNSSGRYFVLIKQLLFK